MGAGALKETLETHGVDSPDFPAGENAASNPLESPLVDVRGQHLHVPRFGEGEPRQHEHDQGVRLRPRGAAGGPDPERKRAVAPPRLDEAGKDAAGEKSHLRRVPEKRGLRYGDPVDDLLPKLRINVEAFHHVFRRPVLCGEELVNSCQQEFPA